MAKFHDTKQYRLAAHHRHYRCHCPCVCVQFCATSSKQMLSSTLSYKQTHSLTRRSFSRSQIVINLIFHSMVPLSFGFFFFFFFFVLVIFRFQSIQSLCRKNMKHKMKRKIFHRTRRRRRTKPKNEQNETIERTAKLSARWGKKAIFAQIVKFGIDVRASCK